jgi:hypothetical protein
MGTGSALLVWVPVQALPFVAVAEQLAVVAQWVAVPGLA